MRKPRRWNSAGWRKDDRITSAVCLPFWLFESLNQGKVYEKPVVGVSNSLFLLRFSYYKSAVRSKCFTCDLILCRRTHLGSTLWPGGNNCLESSRDPINLSCYKERGFTGSLVITHGSGNSPVDAERNHELQGSNRATTLRTRRTQLTGEEGAVDFVNSKALSFKKEALSLVNIFCTISFLKIGYFKIFLLLSSLARFILSSMVATSHIRLLKLKIIKIQ